MAWKQNGTEEQRGAIVPGLPALTSAAAVSVPTKAEYDALRNDLIAMRTAFTNLVTNLRDTNTVD